MKSANNQNQEKKEESDKSQIKNFMEKQMDDFISTFSFLMKDRYTRQKDTPREILRVNANFKPIETLTKEFAFHQFVCINFTILKMEGARFEPSDWKDEKLVEKLEKKILYYDTCAENWNDWVINKTMFNMHPETMGGYVNLMKRDDYIWQLLSRQLLIYKTFSAVIDDEIIEKEFAELKKDDSKSETTNESDNETK